MAIDYSPSHIVNVFKLGIDLMLMLRSRVYTTLSSCIFSEEIAENDDLLRTQIDCFFLNERKRRT